MQCPLPPPLYSWPGGRAPLNLAFPGSCLSQLSQTWSGHGGAPHYELLLPARPPMASYPAPLHSWEEKGVLSSSWVCIRDSRTVQDPHTHIHVARGHLPAPLHPYPAPNFQALNVSGCAWSGAARRGRPGVPVGTHTQPGSRLSAGSCRAPGG